ncbi:glycosyltransferase [Psychrobacter sp. Arc29]|uniref:glycosyltransferase family 2 protein n=1 Tax=Psychrobacter sp. Arc29 TaxID=3046690 RepID=UPI00352C0AE7
MLIFPKVSIIVPVYNGEQFLKRCLDSISSQSYENIEIVIINDGSTDNTKKICEHFLPQEPRARVIHKENEGVSVARNTGLSLVVGEYIYFVDADDYVLPEGIEHLVRKAVESSSDLVVGEYYVASDTSEIKVSPQIASHSNDFLCSILSGENHSALWNKLFKNTLFNDIKFSTNIRYMEDKVLVSQLLMVYQPKIAFLNYPVYVYWQDKSSVTNSKDIRMLDIFVAYSLIETYINKITNDVSVKEAFASCTYRCLWSVLTMIESQYLKEAFIRAKEHNDTMNKYQNYSSIPLKVRFLILSLKLPTKVAIPIIFSIRKGLNQLSPARRHTRH